MSEMPLPEASDHLSEVARLAVETDSVVYLTDRRRRLVAIVPAAAVERLERDDAQRMRFWLADAGLLDSGERLAQEAPAEEDVAAAYARAGLGRPLSDYVSAGR
ncbi:hypothetical protein [Frankia sp. Cas4]|uniref:hypothetical protein n=1 Tax=Frankia sp. Cas4 TaxID=3073927 RepID=UPI002AD2BEBD|nr:hypothetical protein [Frankia sp. Cas4]